MITSGSTAPASGVAAVGATILGTLAALALVRYRFAGRDLLQSLFLSPLSLPAIVLGIALRNAVRLKRVGAPGRAGDCMT